MYTLIDGSPKVGTSNSMYFLNKISEHLNDYNIFQIKNDKFENIISSILKSDAIVLAFPLYVDSPTSIILEVLDYIVDNNINLNNRLVYAIINCGFREGQQNITACEIIKRWCEKVGAVYASCIMIGAGEIVGKEKFNFISKKALKNLNKFANTVKFKQKSSDIITTMDLFNNRMYCFAANLSWHKKGRRNNLSHSKLKAK